MFIAGSTWAQSFSLKTDAQTIGKNDVLQVEYEVKNGSDISDFLAPAFADWKIMAGPSTSQSMVSINGQTTRTFSYVYILMPLKTGHLSVPGTNIIADGKKLQCKGTDITVTNQSLVKPAPQPGNSLQSLFDDPSLQDLFTKDPVLKANEDPAEVMRKNIFLKTSVSKNTCFVGEPVLVTYKLYTAIHTEARVTKQPSFSGCSVIEMPADDSSPLVEHINGKDYRAYLIRKVMLVPLQEGQLNLDAAEVENEVNFEEAGNPYSVKKYSSTIKNPLVSIKVNALPLKNRPADFSGAEGNFSIGVDLKNKTPEAGENNSLIVTISGNGNMQSVELPRIDWPENVDHFDATKKEDVNKARFPFSGSITFEIPFIGLTEGRKTIPSVKWNYFDLTAGDYKTISTDSLSINFLKASKTATIPENAVVREDLSNKKYLWIVAGIAVVAFVLLFFTLRKGTVEAKREETLPASWQEITEQTETVLPSPSIAKTDFKHALEMLSNIEEPGLFYTTAKTLLAKALQEFLVTDAPFNTMAALAGEKKNDTALAQKCVEINRSCEFALYSGMSNERNREDVINGLTDVINSLHI